jgi:hypothetical protein
MDAIDRGRSPREVLEMIIHDLEECTRVAANRLLNRAFDCIPIQSFIRGGTPPTVIDPRYPLLPSHPQNGQPDRVTIVTRIRSTNMATVRYVTAMADGLAGDTYVSFANQIEAIRAAYAARYATATVVVVDPCWKIY